MKKFKLTLLASVLSFSSFTYANPSSWHYEITPYLWGISMDGQVGVGPYQANFNQSFSELLRKLDFAFMLYFAAHTDHFGTYLNTMYAVTSDDTNAGPYRVRLRNRYGIFGGGLTYLIYATPSVEWVPYIGVRYTMNDTTLKVDNLGGSENANWADPLIGLQFKYFFNDAWSLVLSGDFGGTGRDRHYSYSAMGLMGYNTQLAAMAYSTVYLGYRFLDQFYQRDSGLKYYKWNARIQGPLLGISFSF